MKIDYDHMAQSADAAFYPEYNGNGRKDEIAEEVVLQVKTAEESVSKSGNPMLVLTLTDSDNAARIEIREYIVFPSPEFAAQSPTGDRLAQERLNGFIAAFHPTINDGELDVDACVGLTGRALCYSETSGDFPKQNKVLRYLNGENAPVDAGQDLPF